MTPAKLHRAAVAAALLILFAVQGAFAQLADFPAKDGESLWASSSLEEVLGGRYVVYGPEALFDGDISSPWVEGADGSGVGENVLILTQRPVEAIRIVNGFASSPNLFSANNRVKTLKASLVAGLTAPGMVSENDYVLYKVKETEFPDRFLLADAPGEQVFRMPLSEEEQYALFLGAVEEFRGEEPFLFSMICRDLGVDEENTGLAHYAAEVVEFYGFFAVRLTIEAVYPGRLYDDTCIAEIGTDLGRF